MGRRNGGRKGGGGGGRGGRGSLKERQNEAFIAKERMRASLRLFYKVSIRFL